MSNFSPAEADFIVGIMAFCAALCVSRVAKRLKLSPTYQKMMTPLSIVLITTGINFAVIKPFFDKQQNNVDYRAVIKQINDSADGKYVDDVTRIDSVTLGRNNEFIFNYSIVNVKSTEVDDSSREAFKDSQISARRASPKTAMFLKKGISAVFRYFGSDSVLITEFRIDPPNAKQK